MPAVPLVMGAVSVASGITAFGTTAILGSTMLGSLAAGASILGGAAMIAGTIKGGAKGNKWISIGGLLALGGSLGTSMGSKITAGVATNAAAEGAVATARTAPGSFTDALIKGSPIDMTAPPSSVSQLIANNPLNSATLPSVQTMAAFPSVQTMAPDFAAKVSANASRYGMPWAESIKFTQQQELAAAPYQALAEQQRTANLMQIGGSMLQGAAEEQQANDQRAFQTKLDNDRFARVQYRPLAV